MGLIQGLNWKNPPARLSSAIEDGDQRLLGSNNAWRFLFMKFFMHYSTYSYAVVITVASTEFLENIILLVTTFTSRQQQMPLKKQMRLGVTFSVPISHVTGKPTQPWMLTMAKRCRVMRCFARLALIFGGIWRHMKNNRIERTRERKKREIVHLPSNRCIKNDWILDC
jgi:hypothetical protein